MMEKSREEIVRERFEFLFEESDGKMLGEIFKEKFHDQALEILIEQTGLDKNSEIDLPYTLTVRNESDIDEFVERFDNAYSIDEINEEIFEYYSSLKMMERFIFEEDDIISFHIELNDEIEDVDDKYPLDRDIEWAIEESYDENEIRELLSANEDFIFECGEAAIDAGYNFTEAAEGEFEYELRDICFNKTPAQLAEIFRDDIYAYGSLQRWSADKLSSRLISDNLLDYEIRVEPKDEY